MAVLASVPIEPQGVIGRVPFSWANRVEPALGSRFNLDRELDRSQLRAIARQGQREKSSALHLRLRLAPVKTPTRLAGGSVSTSSSGIITTPSHHLRKDRRLRDQLSGGKVGSRQRLRKIEQI